MRKINIFHQENLLVNIENIKLGIKKEKENIKETFLVIIKYS